MNTMKTFVLMMILSGLLVVIGFAIGGVPLLIVFLVIALAMNFFAYWSSDKIALKMAKAHPVTEQDDPELYRIVAEQAELSELPMPKVYEIESDSPNAFATGRNPQHATVAVTTGIRRILNREELGGVLAHEMAHVGNRDTLIMAVVATIAGAISMLAFMAQMSAIFGGFGGGRDRGGNMIGLLVIAVVMPLAAGLVRAAISRTREFQADASGARTSGQRPRFGQRPGKAGNGHPGPTHASGGRGIPFIHRKPPEGPVHGQLVFDPSSHRGTGEASAGDAPQLLNVD